MLNTDKPIVTYLIVAIAVIVVGTGAVSVITDGITYQEWLDQLTRFAVGAGLVGIGRGIAAK